MRKIISLTCFLVCFMALHGQEKSVAKNQKVGITFSSFGENDVIRFNELDGAAFYEGKNFYALGIQYTCSIKNWLALETGLEFAEHDVTIHPVNIPGADLSTREGDFMLITVPVTIKASIFKYLFINGGVILDMDISTNSPIDSQTGLGPIAGVGLQYEFNFGASVFLNPYLRIHSLLPFADVEYHQRVWENGFRFGILYHVGK